MIDESPGNELLVRRARQRQVQRSVSAPGCPPAPPICHVCCCALTLCAASSTSLLVAGLTVESVNQTGLAIHAGEGQEPLIARCFDGRWDSECRVGR